MWHIQIFVYTDENFAITGIRLYFLSFSQKHDRKGSSQKNIHRRQISPSTVVYIIKKTVVCIPIIYRTYVESSLSIIIVGTEAGISHGVPISSMHML